jgi:hypothetical protein
MAWAASIRATDRQAVADGITYASTIDFDHMEASSLSPPSFWCCALVPRGCGPAENAALMGRLPRCAKPCHAAPYLTCHAATRCQPMRDIRPGRCWLEATLQKPKT